MLRPVIVMTGFLDAGKSTSIMRTLLDPRFTEDERTLIICFEEGDVAFNNDFLEKTNSVVEYLDFERFNIDLLSEFISIHDPDRIMIEFNGMDDDRDLYKVALPRGFAFADRICIVDASKFRLYMKNMPQFMFNHISTSQLVVFNRYDGEDLRYLRTNVKSMNQGIACCLEDSDGNMMPLPTENLFDVNNLLISDLDFGLFYMDVVDNPYRYQDKRVVFNGFCFDNDGRRHIFGRMAMVCCANDVQRLAINVFLDNEEYEVGHYYQIEGFIRIQERDSGIALFVEGVKVQDCALPEQELVSFS